MEMQIYVKIKAFSNRGSVPYGVWTLGLEIPWSMNLGVHTVY
jgi:hypothetical protein